MQAGGETMSEALSELTKEAVSLPYEEQKELLDVIRISIHNIEERRRMPLDFSKYDTATRVWNEDAQDFVNRQRANDRL